MKKVCPKCGGKRLHKHGKKRRKCIDCGSTCAIQSGRPRTQFSEAYIKDRSTLRRIGEKMNISHTTVLFHLKKEMEEMPSLLEITKNFL